MSIVSSSHLSIFKTVDFFWSFIYLISNVGLTGSNSSTVGCSSCWATQAPQDSWFKVFSFHYLCFFRNSLDYCLLFLWMHRIFFFLCMVDAVEKWTFGKIWCGDSGHQTFLSLGFVADAWYGVELCVSLVTFLNYFCKYCIPCPMVSGISVPLAWGQLLLRPPFPKVPALKWKNEVRQRSPSLANWFCVESLLCLAVPFLTGLSITVSSPWATRSSGDAGAFGRLLLFFWCVVLRPRVAFQISHSVQQVSKHFLLRRLSPAFPPRLWRLLDPAAPFSHTCQWPVHVSVGVV